MSIKNVKPSKRSRYKQGYIDPASCKKLLDRSSPVIYRSSYERRFITWLESSPAVRSWASESLAIPYTWPDGSSHLYYPDYIVEHASGEVTVVEIKPKNQTRAPVNENSYAAREWKKNQLKWQAALQYCETRGLKFRIFTEDTINRL